MGGGSQVTVLSLSLLVCNLASLKLVSAQSSSKKCSKGIFPSSVCRRIIVGRESNAQDLDKVDCRL